MREDIRYKNALSNRMRGQNQSPADKIIQRTKYTTEQRQRRHNANIVQRKPAVARQYSIDDFHQQNVVSHRYLIELFVI